MNILSIHKASEIAPKKHGEKTKLPNAYTRKESCTNHSFCIHD